MRLLHRGDVVPLPPPRAKRGHEQRGKRYGIVLQSSALAGLSTVVIAPTSTSAQPTAFRPTVTVRGKSTRVLIEQLTAVDRTQLPAPVGHLAVHELAEVEDGLRLFFGLV